MSGLGNKNVFAENLRMYLNDKGISQTDLAMAVGVSKSNVCDWLARRAYPRMDRLQRVADYLGVSLSDLMEEHSEDNPYYLEKEVQKMAQELYDNPEARALFRASKNLSKGDMATVRALIDSLTKK